MPDSWNRVVVLGLGNPIVSDDAAGLKVAEEIGRLLAERPIAGVSVRLSMRGGFEFIDLLQGCDHAIIVDCLEEPDGVPGTVRKLGPEKLAGSSRLTGMHGINLRVAFEFAAETGAIMPGCVEIYGIVPADCRTFREGLSPAVAVAVQRLAREIYTSLETVA